MGKHDLGRRPENIRAWIAIFQWRLGNANRSIWLLGAHAYRDESDGRCNGVLRQRPVAPVSLAFFDQAYVSGSAMYLYGTTGPGYSSASITLDGTLVDQALNLSVSLATRRQASPTDTIGCLVVNIPADLVSHRPRPVSRV
jgi:hypothetical protein